MRTRRTSFALGAMAVASLAWQGCSTDNVTTAPGGAIYDAANNNKTLASSGWKVVASTKMSPGLDDQSLQGSRYSLFVPHQALENAVEVSISERSPKVVDVKLDPDGSVFKVPVTLVIDYTGTPNDPDSPYYTGFAPSVRHFNPSTNDWTPVAGTDNPSTKTYTVQLVGFSRYAMTDGMQSLGVVDGHTQKIQ